MATKTQKPNQKSVRLTRAKKQELDDTGSEKQPDSKPLRYAGKRRSPETVRDRKERFRTATENTGEQSSGLKGLGLIAVGHTKKLELRDRLGMARSMFGRIVNVAERTIAKVEAGSETPDKLKRPYNEVYRLWEALGELVEPSAIGPWFQKPNDAFDGLKPIEIIERGEIDRLWDMVFELQSGMPR